MRLAAGLACLVLLAGFGSAGPAAAQERSPLHRGADIAIDAIETAHRQQLWREAWPDTEVRP